MAVKLEHPSADELAPWRLDERVRAALVAGRIAMWDWDPASDAITGSEMIEALLGLRPGEAWRTGAQAASLLHPEDRDSHRALVESAVRAGGGWHNEFRIVRPVDGTVAWVEERAQAVRDPRTGQTRFVGVLCDITERKDVEEALRASESRQALLLQLGDKVAALGDPYETMTFACEALARELRLASAQFGLVDTDEGSAEVVASFNDGRLPRIVPGHRFRMGPQESAWAEVLRAGHELFRDEESGSSAFFGDIPNEVGAHAGFAIPLMHGGRLVACLAGATPGRREWAEGERMLLREVAQRLWVAYDRAQAQWALRAWEERLQRAFSIDTVGVLFFNLAGPVIAANAAFERMSGYTREELLQTQWQELTPPDFRGVTLRAAAQLATRGEAPPYEKQLVRKDGSRWWGLFAPRRLTGKGTDSECVEFVLDINERKRVEEELRYAREQLEARVDDRTRDLATANESLRGQISERLLAEKERRELQRRLVNAQEAERRRIARELHDQLGQQVSALTFKLAMLRRDARLAAEMREEIERLEKIAAETDSQLDFLVWKLRPTALDDLGLGPALADYVSEWSKHFGIEARIQSVGFTGRRLDAEVETVLYRIAQEALNNVAKHAHAKLVTVGLERTAKAVSLVIRDDGEGFELIQPRKSETRGLGLVSMRERAELVGGEVAVHSEPGKGTSVAVLVPLSTGRANRRSP